MLLPSSSSSSSPPPSSSSVFSRKNNKTIYLWQMFVCGLMSFVTVYSSAYPLRGSTITKRRSNPKETTIAMEMEQHRLLEKGGMGMKTRAPTVSPTTVTYSPTLSLSDLTNSPTEEIGMMNTVPPQTPPLTTAPTEKATTAIPQTEAPEVTAMTMTTILPVRPLLPQVTVPPELPLLTTTTTMTTTTTTTTTATTTATAPPTLPSKIISPFAPILDDKNSYVVDLAPFSITVEGANLQEDLGMTAYMDYQMKHALGSSLIEVIISVVNDLTTPPIPTTMTAYSSANDSDSDSDSADIFATARRSSTKPPNRQLLFRSTIQFVGTARFAIDEEPFTTNSHDSDSELQDTATSSQQANAHIPEEQVQFLQYHILQDRHALTAYWDANSFIGTALELITIDFYGAEFNNDNNAFGPGSNAASSNGLAASQQEQTLWMIVFCVGGVFVAVLVVGMLYIFMLRATQPCGPPEDPWKTNNHFEGLDRNETIMSTPSNTKEETIAGRLGATPNVDSNGNYVPTVLNFHNDSASVDVSELDYSLTPNHGPGQQKYRGGDKDCNASSINDVSVSCATNSKMEEWSYQPDQQFVSSLQSQGPSLEGIDPSLMGVRPFGAHDTPGTDMAMASMPTTTIRPPTSPPRTFAREAVFPSENNVTSVENSELESNSGSQFSFRNIATRYSFDHSVSVMSSTQGDSYKDMHAFKTNIAGGNSKTNGIITTSSHPGGQMNIATRYSFDNSVSVVSSTIGDYYKDAGIPALATSAGPPISGGAATHLGQAMQSSMPIGDLDATAISFSMGQLHNIVSDGGDSSAMNSTLHGEELQYTEPYGSQSFCQPLSSGLSLGEDTHNPYETNIQQYSTAQEDDNLSLPSDEMVGDYDHDLGTTTSPRGLMVNQQHNVVPLRAVDATQQQGQNQHS